MPVEKSTPLDANWTRKDFATTPIMSTYILAFVVGHFKSRNATILDSDGREYSVSISSFSRLLVQGGRPA